MMEIFIQIAFLHRNEHNSPPYSKYYLIVGETKKTVEFALGIHGIHE